MSCCWEAFFKLGVFFSTKAFLCLISYTWLVSGLGHIRTNEGLITTFSNLSWFRTIFLKMIFIFCFSKFCFNFNFLLVFKFKNSHVYGKSQKTQKFVVSEFIFVICCATKLLKIDTDLHVSNKEYINIEILGTPCRVKFVSHSQHVCAWLDTLVSINRNFGDIIFWVAFKYTKSWYNHIKSHHKSSLFCATILFTKFHILVISFQTIQSDW